MPSFRPFVAGHLALAPGNEGNVTSFLQALEKREASPNKMVKSIVQCLRML